MCVSFKEHLAGHVGFNGAGVGAEGQSQSSYQKASSLSPLRDQILEEQCVTSGQHQECGRANFNRI